MQYRRRHTPRLAPSAYGLGDKSEYKYWTAQKLADIFLAIYYFTPGTYTIGDHIPNQVLGAVDFLTVTDDTSGAETFQCPNDVNYISADTDFIWFKSDGVQRTETTTDELVGYDLQRTLVRYDNDSPNTLRMLGILKSTTVLTDKELDDLFKWMSLPLEWNNTTNRYGIVKSNRLGNTLWVPEEVWPVILDDANVATWLRYTDSSLITKDSSERVALWKDFKNSGNDPEQSTDALKPIWSVDGITFNGLLSNTQSLKKAFTLIQPVSVYMVARILSTRGSGDEIAFTGATAGMHLYQRAGTSSLYMFGGGGELSTGIPVPINTFNVYTAQYTGASSNLKLDSTQGGNINIGTSSPGGLTLGARYDVSGYGLNIQIKEIIVRRIIDTAGNKTIIENYLKTKYGL